MMHGIFLLDSHRLTGSLDDRPLAVHWIANGPVVHQLINSWEGVLDSAEVWIPAAERERVKELLATMPLNLRVEIHPYEPANRFPAALLLERAAHLPAGGIILASDEAIVMPGSFDPPADCGCVAWGPTAVWLSGPNELVQRAGSREINWPSWVNQLQPEKELSPTQYLPLVDHVKSDNHNELFFTANRRLLAIGRSSGNALERSYTEEFTVIPPVYIDPEAEVYTSVIGPYAAVGPGAIVENSVIRHTVIDREAQVRDTLLEMSYVGPEVAISGKFSRIQTTGEEEK